MVSVLSERVPWKSGRSDAERIDGARIKPERTALAHRYAENVNTSDNPAPSEQCIAIMEQLAS